VRSALGELKAAADTLVWEERFAHARTMRMTAQGAEKEVPDADQVTARTSKFTHPHASPCTADLHRAWQVRETFSGNVEAHHAIRWARRHYAIDEMAADILGRCAELAGATAELCRLAWGHVVVALAVSVVGRFFGGNRDLGLEAPASLNSASHHALAPRPPSLTHRP
jgi:hypothetical protein